MARSDGVCLQVRSRASLFGVAELDSILPYGGVEAGMLHVVEPACREGVRIVDPPIEISGAAATGLAKASVKRSRTRAGSGDEARMQAAADAAATMAFALGFAARSGTPACWIGPAPDLLTPYAMPPDMRDLQLHIHEEPWGARTRFDPRACKDDGMRVFILDARRAERLSPPVRLARKLVKQGHVAVLLTADADQLVGGMGTGQASASGASHKNVHGVRWRIAQVKLPDGDGVSSDVWWQVELMRSDAVRRVLAGCCDNTGRMRPAPRSLEPPGGKEMMRRFARA